MGSSKERMDITEGMLSEDFLEREQSGINWWWEYLPDEVGLWLRFDKSERGQPVMCDIFETEHGLAGTLRDDEVLPLVSRSAGCCPRLISDMRKHPDRTWFGPIPDPRTPATDEPKEE